MRPVLLLLFGATALVAQPFGFGVKGGVPMNDFINAVSSPNFLGYTTTTDRYIIGPMVELRLPFGLGVEFDALYRHYSFQNTIFAVGARTGAWEFPLVAKYRFHFPVVRPYIEGGIAWDKLSGFEQFVSGGLPPTPFIPAPEVRHDTVSGYVLGAGVDLHLLIIHIAPEIRYTRWGAQHFLGPNGGFSSDQNQAEFLVGITF